MTPPAIMTKPTMFRFTTFQVSGAIANARMAPTTIRKMPLPIPMVTTPSLPDDGRPAQHDHGLGQAGPRAEIRPSLVGGDVPPLRQPGEHRVVLDQLGVAVAVGRTVAAPRGALVVARPGHREGDRQGQHRQLADPPGDPAARLLVRQRRRPPW